MENQENNQGQNQEQNNQQQNQQNNQQNAPKTFDEILADKSYQSEFDRRVTKALETARTNWEESVNKKPDESQKPEQPPAISPEMQAMMDTVKQLEKKLLDSETKEVEKVELELLAGDDFKVPADQRAYYHFNITQLAKAKGLSFADAAAEHIKANPPFIAPPPMVGGSTKVYNTEMTKDDYKKLTYKERLELKEKQPVLYKQLTGGK